jgi:TolA-binding protein
MHRLRLAVTCSLALFLGAGWLMGQDGKSTSDDTPSQAKVKGALPTYYGRLGLTDEQKQKVYKIHQSYKSKIDALKDQIADLSNQQQVELLKVLNDTQRTHLRELQTREPKEKTPSKDAPKTDDTKKDSSKTDEKK